MNDLIRMFQDIMAKDAMTQILVFHLISKHYKKGETVVISKEDFIRIVNERVAIEFKKLDDSSFSAVLINLPADPAPINIPITPESIN